MSVRLSGLFDKKRLILSGIILIFWAAFGISPFIVVLLREQRIGTAAIGLILSVNSFVGIIGQPFWGMVSDKIRSVKITFILCMSMCTITYAILLFADSPLYIGIILAVDAFFRSAASSLLDIWIINSISKDNNISYGALRLWGSIGFALMVLAYGAISDGRSVKVIFPIYFIVAVIAIILSFFIKSGNSSSARRVSLRELKPGKLFSDTHYLAFVAFVFLINLPASPAGTFLPDLFKEVEGNMGEYGLMHSVKALLEVPFFLFGKKLMDRFGSIRIIICSSLIYTIQQIIFACAATPLQVMLAQMLLGPAYSLFLIGSLHYVFSLAPEDLKATSQTFLNAFGSGLGSIAGNYGGGLFITWFGLRPMYWTGAALDIAAIALFLLSFRLIRAGSLSPDNKAVPVSGRDIAG